MKIFILILFVLLSIISIFGYGKLFESIFLKKIILRWINWYFRAFLLSIISYFTHIFIPHGYLHNSVVFIISVSTL